MRCCGTEVLVGDVVRTRAWVVDGKEGEDESRGGRWASRRREYDLREKEQRRFMKELKITSMGSGLSTRAEVAEAGARLALGSCGMRWKASVQQVPSMYLQSFHSLSPMGCDG